MNNSRFFTANQRNQLFLNSDGKCQSCKREISLENFQTNKKDMIKIRIINEETKVFDICQIIKECTIDEISKYLIKEGNNKSFPDITTRQ